MLHMVAGRIFTCIDSIGGRIPDKGCASEPQKSEKLKICEKFVSFHSEAFNFSFSMFFQLVFTLAVTRRAGCSHPHSKSNTVSGKI